MNKYYEVLKKHWIISSIVIFILGGNILFGRFFLLNLAASIRWDIAHSEHSLIDPSSVFVDRKDLIVNVRPLRVFLTNVESSLDSDKVSIYFEMLNTGANISINKDVKIFPASLAKLPLGIVIMKKVEDGEINLKDNVVLDSKYFDPRSGNLYKNPPGTSLTIDRLLYSLLVDSDNTAQRALLDQISISDMEDLILATGLEDLADPKGQISAKEYTRFLRVLYFSSFLKEDDSQKILSLLAQASFKDFLSQGVPNDVTFSHKYGEEITAKIYLDSGVVYVPGRAYMLTVMFQGIEEDKAKELMKSISEAAYKYVSEYHL